MRELYWARREDSPRSRRPRQDPLLKVIKVKNRFIFHAFCSHTTTSCSHPSGQYCSGHKRFRMEGTLSSSISKAERSFKSSRLWGRLSLFSVRKMREIFSWVGLRGTQSKVYSQTLSMWIHGRRNKRLLLLDGTFAIPSMHHCYHCCVIILNKLSNKW